jgi:hypothetical protein
LPSIYVLARSGAVSLKLLLERRVGQERAMLDLVYLALGLGVFAMLGLYAVAADRL